MKHKSQLHKRSYLLHNYLVVLHHPPLYLSSGNHKQKFYFGKKEIMLPVYKELAEAAKRHPSADVLINFASLRSAYDSTMEALEIPQVRIFVTMATVCM